MTRILMCSECEQRLAQVTAERDAAVERLVRYMAEEPARFERHWRKVQEHAVTLVDGYEPNH